MNLSILANGPSALIVVGGTLLATVLRCGVSDCRVTLSKLGQLGRSHFDAERTRAELARQVQGIRQDLAARQAHRPADLRQFPDWHGTC